LLSIFEQVCQTVAFAHAQGILHRDLKPANIMVGAFGEVQLMDWGLAKKLRNDGCGMMNDDQVSASIRHSSCIIHHSEQTETGRVLGTAAYMAPEQARGEVERLDQRCDVFGLGAILCEILTGQPPFAADSQVENRRCAAAADLADAFARLNGSGAEPELVRLAKKCLAADMEQRPADAGAVAEELAAYQTRVSARLRQAEIERAQAQARAEEERKRRQAEQARAAAERKRRQLAVLLAAVAALFFLAAAAAGVWYYQDRATMANEEAERARDEFERKSKEDKQAASEEAHHKALEQQVSAALADTEPVLQELHQKLVDPLKVSELLSDLKVWKVQLEKADAAWQRARVLAAGATRPFGGDLAAKLAALEKQLQADSADYQTAQKLDKIRMMAAVRWQGSNAVALKKKVSEESGQVFLKLGYDVEKGDVKKMAAQMSQSPLRFVLVAALDYWAEMMPIQQRNDLIPLFALARKVDPDRWRDRLRTAAVWIDPEALLKLAAEVDPATQSPHFLGALASQLYGCHQKEASAKVLHKALDYHPKDFWLHFQLAFTLTDSAQQEHCYRAALAIRPDSVIAHNNLAMALHVQKDYEGAIAHYKQATANPHSASPQAYSNWGAVLSEINDLDGAVAMYQKALAINANLPTACASLANVLERTGDSKGAIPFYRKALSLYPEWSSGQTDGSYNRFLPTVHYSLGLALYELHQYDEATAYHQKAVKIDPAYAEAYLALAQALLQQGRFAEAEENNRHCVGLLTSKHDPHFKKFAQEELQLSKQLLALDQNLTAVLQGQLRPQKANHHLNLARFCQLYKDQYATAANFYVDAFAADPKLADEPPHRYMAARAAAAAGTGKGKEVEKLDETAKAKLRQQALDWLKAELAGRPQFHGGGVKSAVALTKTMPLWLREPDLAGVRDTQALAKLPKAEQEAWQVFWSDVAKLLKQAQGSFKESKLPGKLTALERKQVHTVKLAAGKTYVFELVMKQLQNYKRLENNLRLEDPEGKLLAEDINSGSNWNSRIIYAPATAGTYRLVATSVLQEGTGPYTLTIWEFTSKPQPKP
jgi:tetratricopeptide (TPR) repeat protein